LDVGRNNLLPRLDAVVEAGFQGLDENYSDAVDNQFDFDSTTFAAGFQFEIPLGNRAARAIERRARLQRLQAATQAAQLTQQITLDVKQAQQNVSAAYSALVQLRNAVDAAAEAVRVIEAQGEQVQLTPQFSDLVLRTLDDLSAARSAEEQALAEYNAAIATYERSKGTLLRYNNIVLDDAQRDAILPLNRPALGTGAGVAP
ncbi:MAG: TolC family protein, partial [Planctomycetota bacterium]